MRSLAQKLSRFAPDAAAAVAAGWSLLLMDPSHPIRMMKLHAEWTDVFLTDVVGWNFEMLMQ